LIGRDFCDFVPSYFQSPRFGGFLQGPADHGIQPGASVQDLVQFHLPDGRSHGGLRVLRDAVQWIEGPVRGLLGVVEPHEEIPRHLDAHVVARDGGLGRYVEGPFPHVDHVRDVVDDGDAQEQAAVLHGVQFPEPFHDVLVSLRYNVEDGVGRRDGPPPRIGTIESPAAHGTGGGIRTSMIRRTGR